MNEIISRAIHHFFSDEILKNVAFGVLLNEHSREKSIPMSLQMLSLKSLISKKVKKDLYWNLIFRLIFREEIDIAEFAKRFSRRTAFGNFRRKVWDLVTGYTKTLKIYQKMKADPFIMQSVFEQNLPVRYGHVKIIVSKKQLVIHYNFQVVTKIPHPTDKDYDIHWANVFARIILSRSTNFVVFGMEGEEDSDIVDVENKLNAWFATITPKIPPEGWKSAIENGKLIYNNYPTLLRDQNIAEMRFFIASEAPIYSDGCWGYLGNL